MGSNHRIVVNPLPLREGLGGGGKLFSQCLRQVFRPVSNYDVRTGSLDRSQTFQHGFLFIEPAHLGGSLDHGIFSADVICRERQIEFLFRTKDIQVGQRRLHHDDVRTFGNIQ